MGLKSILKPTFMGFYPGDKLGPSILNFTLDGLEQVVLRNDRIASDRENFCNKKSSNCSKSLLKDCNIKWCGMVRYAANFVVIVNDHKLALITKIKIKKFLFFRGLKLSNKSFTIVWKNKANIEYLGFIFHCLANRKVTRTAV